MLEMFMMHTWHVHFIFKSTGLYVSIISKFTFSSHQNMRHHTCRVSSYPSEWTKD